MRDYKLSSSKDFRWVLSHKKRRRLGFFCFTAYLKNNSGAAPRLGLVIAKRKFKLAVDRNKVRRVIRESFRHVIPQLMEVDIVLVVNNHGSNKLLQEGYKEKLKSDLGRLWNMLKK